MMAEYSKWCDSESNEKEDAITSNKRTIGDLEADLKDATGIREDEKAAFTDSETELVDTVDSLERALVVLKRGQTSFLQARDQDEMDKLTMILGKIIEASWVNKKDKAAVQALLQSKSADSDEDLSLQPQAAVSEYESHGSGILDTISDMKDKAESTLSDARKAEMEANHEYEMLKQSLETQMSTMKKRMSE